MMLDGDKQAQNDSLQTGGMKNPYRVAVAPMVRVSTTPARCLWRILAPDVYIYTAMVHAQAIIANPAIRKDLVPWSPNKEAVQIADTDPDRLAQAVKELGHRGWQEINLNAGCPARSAIAGGFGLHLMCDPPRLMECLAAMKEAARGLRISLKCRIGVDGVSGYDFILPIIAQAQAIGVDMVILHARAGWTKGMNPKKNRLVPPLDPECVDRIQKTFQNTAIVYNGGIISLSELEVSLERFSGVMFGRWIQRQPASLLDIQQIINPNRTMPSLTVLLCRALDRVDEVYQQGGNWREWLKILLSWLNGRSGAANWRQAVAAILQNGSQEEIVALRRHIQQYGTVTKQ